MEKFMWWRATLFVLVNVQNCDGQTKCGWDCDVREVWNSQYGAVGNRKEKKNLQDIGTDESRV